DEIEMRGLDEVSVDGYFNLHEQRNRKTSASNIKRELEFLERKAQQESSQEQEIKKETPIYQPSILEVKKELEKSIEVIEKPVEAKQKIPKPVIEEAKAKEKENKKVNKTKTKSKRSSLDFNKVGAVIRIMLKEHGKPMEMAQLQKEVEAMMEVSITDNNFRQNLMYRAHKEYKDIVRVGRGLYEFISDEADRKRKEMKPTGKQASSIEEESPKEEPAED